jgi:hypothetical protein
MFAGIPVLGGTLGCCAYETRLGKRVRLDADAPPGETGLVMEMLGGWAETGVRGGVEWPGLLIKLALWRSEERAPALEGAAEGRNLW